MIAMCFFMGCASAHATDYYVSPTGSNTNSGTSREAPYLTCDKAASVVTAGDTVTLVAGTHTAHAGSYYCDIYAEGTEESPITFQGETGTVVDGTYSVHSGFVLWPPAKYIQIKDLEIKRYMAFGIYGTQSYSLGGASHVTIKNNHIHDIGNGRTIGCTEGASYGIAGVYTQPLTTNFTLDGNTIHDIGRLPGGCSAEDYKHDHGYYAQGREHISQNNVYYNCHAGWAIKPDGYCGTLEGDYSMIVRNDTFAFDTNPSSTVFGHIGVYTNASTHCVSDGSVHLSYGKLLVENSAFYQPPASSTNDAAIRVWNTYHTPVVMRNNVTTSPNMYKIYSSPSTGGTYVLNDNKVNETGDFFVDPTPSAPDFTPDPSFYGIDRGYNNGLDHDIIGTSRPAGTGIDVGAYESIATDAIAPTILSTSSTSPDATYSTGAEIPITVTFSEPVTSTGNVTVTLNTGATCTFTVSEDSSGTCTYTVLAGDYTTRLQVSSVSGTIADAESNAMTVFTIPSNMVSNNIVISTPSVAITSPAATDTYSTTEPFLTVSGTAGGAAEISSVTWYCASCTPASGTATGTTTWEIADLGLAFFTNTITITATDSESATVTDSIVITRAEGDTTAPTISNAFPTSAISCTASVSVGLTTDETSTCKLDSTITDYDSMTTTMTASGNSHLAALMLPCNASYTYYARCKDASGNISEATPISFSTSTPPTGVNLTGITHCNGCTF